MSELMHTACTVFGVTADELRGPSREWRIAHARFAVAWGLRQHDPDCSFATIGTLLGGRDHTTILYAIERAEQLALPMLTTHCTWPAYSPDDLRGRGIRNRTIALAAVAARHSDLDAFAHSWDRMSALGWGLQAIKCG